ncbi:MAG: endonuclease/exonuclease/phosphatase family protein [Verrucomicrobiales bacterium]
MICIRPKTLIALWLLCSGFQMSLFGADRSVRVASFNVKMFRSQEGMLAQEMGGKPDGPVATDPQRIAAIIQRMDPDILLLNEFDYDSAGEAIGGFLENYLAVGQDGQDPIEFPFVFVAESNTGISSCFDFDNNGRAEKNPARAGYGEDSFGFGIFPGQYGMAVLSKYPIALDRTRSFQQFLWKDMPGALLPDRAITPAEADWYSAEELEVFRLSSKSHWDVAIDVGGEIIHLLTSHPTPPTFDGSEDRNGLRNHDEIRLWADYVSPDPGDASYLYDDDGLGGGLASGQRFVICGDQNADPNAGDSVDRAILQILDNPAVNASFIPRGSSGTSDTSTFGLRVDYVLPSLAGFQIDGGGIFWPVGGGDGADQVNASDHRLVWMDLRLLPLIGEAVSELELELEIEGEDVLLHWKAEDGIDYGIETSEDLTRWVPEESAQLEVVDGAASYRDEGGARSAGRKFYRVSAAFSE